MGAAHGRVPSPIARGTQWESSELSAMVLVCFTGMQCQAPRELKHGVEVQGPAVRSPRRIPPTWDLGDRRLRETFLGLVYCYSRISPLPSLPSAWAHRPCQFPGVPSSTVHGISPRFELWATSLCSGFCGRWLWQGLNRTGRVALNSPGL